MLLINSGFSDSDSALIQNMLNVPNLDDSRSLLIDMNNMDPVYRLSSSERSHIRGKEVRSLTDLLLEDRNGDGLDYVLIPFDIKKRHVREKMVRALNRSIERFRDQYDHIYVRGFPESF